MYEVNMININQLMKIMRIKLNDVLNNQIKSKMVYQCNKKTCFVQIFSHKELDHACSHAILTYIFKCQKNISFFCLMFSFQFILFMYIFVIFNS